MNRERFGISESHWALIEQLLLLPLREIGGIRLWVFGSRAKGNFGAFSDLDVLLEGDCDPAVISNLSEKLEESILPFRVDLVREQDLAQGYREGVLKERVALE